MNQKGFVPYIRHPDSSDESYPSAEGEAANEMSGAPDHHSTLARCARLYDRARVEGASMAEAMALAEAELGRVLEKWRR